MQESDRNKLAEALQNGTAMSRLTHGEIVSALEFMEALGYDVTKNTKPVYEEQTFKVSDLAETAVVEGEDHSG